MTTKEKKTIAEEATAAATPNLMQRISAIQGEVTRVDKSANVDGKYKAVTHDDVTRMLRPLMVKHGVVSFIDCLSSQTVDTEYFFGKRKAMRLESRFCVTYINIDNSDDRMVVIVEAHAEDTGDKNPGKACSYAQKYADLKTFRITTGEDDEQRLDEKKITEQVLTTESLSSLLEFAESAFGDDADNVLTSMAKNVFQVESYPLILEKHAAVAMRKLKSKAAGG